MALIVIPSHEFSLCLEDGNLVDAIAIIHLLKQLEKFNFKLLLKISKDDYLTILNTKELRILKEYLYSSIQIPFIPITDNLCCEVNLRINGTSNFIAFSKLFINVVNFDLQIPLVLTKDPVYITKIACMSCNFNSMICKNGFCLQFPSLATTTFEELLKVLQNYNLDNQLIYNKTFDERSVQSLISLFFQLIEFTGNQEILNNLQVCKSFIDDLNTAKDDKLAIILSIARMMAHPPCTKKQAGHIYSIDYHPDSIQTVHTEFNRYDIYRVDILDKLANQGRNRNSGSKRVLFGKIEGKTLLIAYTPNHDFDENDIRIRINEFEDHI